MRIKIKHKLLFYYKNYYQDLKAREKHLSSSYKLIPCNASDQRDFYLL